jgi:integrase
MRINNVLAFKVPPPPHWSEKQRRLLEVLQQEEYRHLLPKEICLRAGYASRGTWYQALEDPAFAAAVEALGVKVRRQSKAGMSHLHVSLARDPEEELAKDVWDVRRLKADYPKHKGPSDFKVDFTWIANPMLREQVKQYFRHRLPKWKAKTPRGELARLRCFLTLLPPELHLGTLNREQVEKLLPAIGQLGESSACRSLQAAKAMLDYMATSPAWPGPKPPRGLIWTDEIPSAPEALPRPIPPDVLDQLDPLLDQAVEAMKAGHTPPLLIPMFWDAILILRRTGMRAEDVAHLKALDEHGRAGCLDQDAEGYWWVHIHHANTKMNKDHRIPTKLSDGVVDAVRRQQGRITAIPDHFGEHYLFRTQRGILLYGSLRVALKKLAPSLLHEGHPYVIAPHQFRHTIATDMIEQGVDMYTVKEFLGHASLAMTERYVKTYLSTLKARYDAYRAKKEHTYAGTMLTKEVEVQHDAGATDGGWVEGRVGTLYRSPLPNGIGNCVHLAMLDPCPTPPVCETCPKLQAARRHLPVWENKVQSLLITVEALRDNPIYARARQKHEQELHHAERVVETIRKEGYWDGRIHNT